MLGHCKHLISGAPCYTVRSYMVAHALRHCGDLQCQWIDQDKLCKDDLAAVKDLVCVSDGDKFAAGMFFACNIVYSRWFLMLVYLGRERT